MPDKGIKSEIVQQSLNDFWRISCALRIPFEL